MTYSTLHMKFLHLEDWILLIGSVSSVSGIIYLVYIYTTTNQPPQPPQPPINNPLVDTNLISIDPVIIYRAAKSLPSETVTPTLNSILIQLMELNPITIGGCAIFIAVFVIYWIPSMFFNKSTNEPVAPNILNSHNVGVIKKSSLWEILQKTARLFYLEKSITVWTPELFNEASQISTSLVYECYTPWSDFELFINRVDFSKLNFENIVKYYRVLSSSKLDIFLSAYIKHKRDYNIYLIPAVVSNEPVVKTATETATETATKKAKKKSKKKATKIEFSVLNSYGVPLIVRSSEFEILQKIDRLVYLESLAPVLTLELFNEASQISTSLVYELRNPRSDFEFFVKQVDFNLLTLKNVLDYCRILPSNKLDIFLYAYNNHKRVYRIY